MCVVLDKNTIIREMMPDLRTAKDALSVIRSL